MATFSAFSQSTAKGYPKNALIANFNAYLGAVKLDTLLEATDFSFNDVYKRADKSGDIALNKIFVLTLRPRGVFKNPAKFVSAWRAIISNTDNPSSIYNQLFLHLVSQTGLAPNNLSIRLGGDDAGLYSYFIYYDNYIKVTEPSVTTRGDNETIAFGPGDLNNSMYGGFFRNVVYSAALKDRIKKQLSAFIKGGLKGNAILLPAKEYGSNMIILAANGIKGRITGKYYELVTVQCCISPHVDDGVATKKSAFGILADVSFMFNVVYASDPIALNRYGQCENALNCCEIAVAEYGANMRDIIQNAIDGKN